MTLILPEHYKILQDRRQKMLDKKVLKKIDKKNLKTDLLENHILLWVHPNDKRSLCQTKSLISTLGPTYGETFQTDVQTFDGQTISRQQRFFQTIYRKSLLFLRPRQPVVWTLVWDLDSGRL